MIPCALLTDENLTLTNLPRLADVDSFSHLMNQLGVSTSVAGVKKGEFGRKVSFRAMRSAGAEPRTYHERLTKRGSGASAPAPQGHYEPN